MKYLVIFSLSFFSQYTLANFRAVIDMEAYNFPPPTSSIHKVIHKYKKGDFVELEFGDCSLAFCSVIAPNGKSAWIFDFQITDKTDLEKAHQDYIMAGYDSWDDIDFAVWGSVKEDINKLDSCALRLAHGVNYNPNTDWPAYCNTFKTTRQVRDRVDTIKEIMSDFANDSAELQNIKAGRVWIGATKDAVIAAWGSPLDINKTITANGEREQWVFRNNNYIYLSNGVVSAIQK